MHTRREADSGPGRGDPLIRQSLISILQCNKMASSTRRGLNRRKLQIAVARQAATRGERGKRKKPALTNYIDLAQRYTRVLGEFFIVNGGRRGGKRTESESCQESTGGMVSERVERTFTLASGGSSCYDDTLEGVSGFGRFSVFVRIAMNYSAMSSRYKFVARLSTF